MKKNLARSGDHPTQCASHPKVAVAIWPTCRVTTCFTAYICCIKAFTRNTILSSALSGSWRQTGASRIGTTASRRSGNISLVMLIPLSSRTTGTNSSMHRSPTKQTHDAAPIGTHISSGSLIVKHQHHRGQSPSPTALLSYLYCLQTRHQDSWECTMYNTTISISTLELSWL